ncbi:MAG TPA: ABC transporter substrate-binding protein [Solirubrobacteraceae bacterium]|nr:ABC transporter substrate-binding protein [Solirubrobacteraceae bacterium]
MSIRRYLFAVLSGCVLVLAACGDDDAGEGDKASGAAQNGAPQPAETTLLLSSPEGPAWIGLPTARSEGFLEQEKLEVESQATDGSDFVTQQIIAGNAPYGMAAATAVMLAHQADPSIRAVFCMTSRNIFGITASRPSGITEVAGFAGQELGISEVGGGEGPMVESALQDAGLKAGEDVKLLAIGGSGPAARRAIDTGRVAGYASAYTDILGLQASGADLVDITPEKYAAIPGDCLHAKEETLNDPEQRDIVIRIARAWSKGNLFATSNPDAALEIGCNQFPEDCTDRDFAKSYMDKRLELLTPVGAELGQTDTPYGEPSVEGWQTAADILAETKQLKEPLDVNEIIGTQQVKDIIAEWSDYDRDEIKQQAEAWSG